MLQAAREAKENNNLGKCYKNPLGYNVSPIMIYCRNCNNSYCIPCGQWHFETNHHIAFITNVKLKVFTCGENSKIFYEPHLSNKISPRYEQFPVNITKIINNYYFYESNLINILPIDYIDIIYYTEILFALVYTEKIYIKIQGTGIVWNNFLNKCLKNKIEVSNAPRIGSNDTIGIGITSDKCVFFTYNGFNLLKYINFSCDSIKIILKIKGDKEPILMQPLRSLFVDGFTYFEKEMIVHYKKILKLFIFLHKYKTQIAKKCSDSSNIFNVFTDLKALYTSEQYESLKTLKDCKILGSLKDIFIYNKL